MRHRFLLSHVSIWALVGVVLATAMSSAGPIFYDRVVEGPSPFGGLMVHLETVNEHFEINTLVVRDRLWEAYLNPHGGLITGISAMPSVHNALCILLVLAARHVGRLATLAAGLFATAIFIGSVHLGWHYAIDAYVSAFFVAGIWKLSGWLVKR